MKIKWELEDRELPGIGNVYQGKEYTVPDDMGNALINQKAASEVKAVKKKAKE